MDYTTAAMHASTGKVATVTHRTIDRGGLRAWLAAAVMSVVVLPGLVESAAGADPPILFWASSPVAPDETLLLLGGGLGSVTTIDIRRLADEASEADASDGPGWIPCPVLQPGEHALKVLVPGSLKPGVFAVRIGEAAGGELLVNAADPWWTQGDEGPQATRGGWIRVFGSCLGLGKSAAILLRDEAGTVRGLAPTRWSRWELMATVPEDLAPGRYDVLVANGHGGEAVRGAAGVIQVVDPIGGAGRVFEVSADNSDTSDEEAVVAALQRAGREGGGTVLLRRGVYDMRGAITIPPQTILKGEADGVVTLQWPDLESPPEALVTANDAGLENLSIYCRRHKTVIDSDHTSQRFRMHGVRVRANAFFMHTGPGKTHRGRTAPEDLHAGRVVRVIGRNFQITDCDLFGSGQVVAVDPHTFAGRQRPWYGVIARNRIAYGAQGHIFENVDRLIFEDNEVVGHGSTAGSNGISTYWNNFSRHIFYARNHIHDIYGVDRESTTLDGDGAAYFGTVTARDDRLVLDGDPVFKDYAPTPHTDYRGGVVYVLEGKGAGQYRFVTGHSGRDWAVDRPWDVPLDGTSIVSIVPFRGRSLYVENRIDDAGPLQLYGSAADVILADNVTTRADGLLAWGLSQHGWGWHPVLRCQMLHNTVQGGAGFGDRVSGPAAIMVATSGNDASYAGPLGRAVVIRDNVLSDQAKIALDGTVEDVVVEGNAISNAPIGVRIGADVRGVVIRANEFQDVREPVAGPGARKALVP